MAKLCQWDGDIWCWLVCLVGFLVWLAILKGCRQVPCPFLGGIVCGNRNVAYASGTVVGGWVYSQTFLRDHLEWFMITLNDKMFAEKILMEKLCTEYTSRSMLVHCCSIFVKLLDANAITLSSCVRAAATAFCLASTWMMTGRSGLRYVNVVAWQMIFLSFSSTACSWFDWKSFWWCSWSGAVCSLSFGIYDARYEIMPRHDWSSAMFCRALRLRMSSTFRGSTLTPFLNTGCRSKRFLKLWWETCPHWRQG